MPLDGSPNIETFDFSDPGLYNPVYLQTMKRREPVLHYFGSAGSGKSVFVAQKEIVYSFMPWRKNRKTLVARRYYNSLGQSCYSELKNVIYTWGLEDCFKMGTSPYYLRNLKTGVEFIFIGLDDVEKVKSIRGIDRGWLEEATEVKKMADLNLLRDRLRGFRWKQWTLSYNPTDAEHWINKQIHEKRPSDHFIFKTTYKHNVKLLAIDPDYAVLRESYKETNPNHYRVYTLGQWGKALEGLIYPDFDEVGEMPCEPQAYGLDLGWNDPIALCKVALVDEFGKDRKQLYVEEMLYERKMDIPHFMEKIKDLGVSKNIPIIYDSAQPGPLFASALQNAGYNAIGAEKGPDSVKEGIARVKKYDLRPVLGTKNLIAELNAYSWDQRKDDTWTDTPAKSMDHLMDAMRYATWHISRSEFDFTLPIMGSNASKWR